MKFKIDEQTLKDLHIFGSSTNDKSVFSIFDSTFCKGGKKELDKFFSHPSDSIEFINRRKNTIAFLQKHATGGMCLDKSSLDFAEYYFRHANFITDRPTLFTWIKRFIGKFNNSRKHHIVDKGVVSMVKILKGLAKFADSLSEKAVKEADCPSYLSERIAELQKRLQDTDFEDAFKEGRLSPMKITELDYVFRMMKRDLIRFFFDFIYEFDAYITVAQVAARHRFCFPEVLPEKENTLEIEGLYHPLIENAVASDVTIDGDKKLLFVSGPNMAGKSTFLKALGIAVYLAHIGLPVPARKMRLSVLSGISTTINLSDDLNLGYSHFYAEVKRIKEVATELSTNRNMLIIFDELFRGTNVKDAYDGTLAIASAFANIKSSLFIISSHIVEVAEELKKGEGIRFGYFEVKEEDGAHAYTYQLKEGITNLRLGMHIINQEGLIDYINKISENNKTK